VIAPEPHPFTPAWPEPAQRFLRADLRPAPDLPLSDVLGPKLAAWIADATDGAAGLLSS
jgi:hypothetical protein